MFFFALFSFQICEPCNINFNAIIKSDESVVEDSVWLFKKLNLTDAIVADWREITGYEGKAAHVGPGGKGVASSGDVALEFMHQIPKEKLKLLYKKYKTDFVMFGYSIDEYL